MRLPDKERNKVRNFSAAAVVAISIFVAAPQVAHASIATLFSPFSDLVRPLLKSLISTAPAAGEPSEITHIKKTHRIDERVRWYRTLIERVGPEEAQELLYRSGFPFDGETHLLNHVSGDYLYETRGVGGILSCKDYFLSSCYHGLILRTVADRGMDGLDAIMATCREKGQPVAAQCAHGIGHGLVAWYGYRELPRAAGGCDALATRDDWFPTFNCYDGVFMENLWGTHEGAPSPDRWIDEGDNLFPCNDPRIKEEWRVGCWANQGSALYQRFRGDIERVSAVCLTLPPTLERSCFDSLARQIHPVANGDIDRVFQLCRRIPQPWDDFCLTTVAAAEFSVGGRETPFQICARITPNGRRDCYEYLIKNITMHYEKTRDGNFLCKEISIEEYKDSCVVQTQP